MATNFTYSFKKIVLIGLAIIAGLLLVSGVLSYFVGPAGVSRNSQIVAPGMGGANSGLTDLLGINNYTGKSSVPESASTASDSQLTERKMIKIGTLELLVKSADQTVADMQGIAERLGGFVSASNVYEISANTKTGSITIRVPADRFNEALQDTKKLAIKVERENVSAQDVTEH